MSDNRLGSEIGNKVRIGPPDAAIGAQTRQHLVENLQECPDVAFAYLATVSVEAQAQARAQEEAGTLFVWLRREAMASIRMALNLVSEAVSRALPDDVFLDVVILNSAPELLEQVERYGSLLVELDAEERQNAASAARLDSPPESPVGPRSPWWWPFS